MSTATATPRKRKARNQNLLAGFGASIEEQSALDQYLRDVSRHELISPEREKELGALAQRVTRTPSESSPARTCAS